MSRINATKNSRRITSVMRLPNGSEQKAELKKIYILKSLPVTLCEMKGTALLT